MNFNSNRTFLYLALIISVGFLVYVNSLPNGFLWDDEEQIVNNLVIRSWSNLPLIFTSSTFYAGGAGLSGGFYRPLVTLSYLLNYHIWGLNPFGFRLFQIVFHLSNSVLLFFILRKILLAQGINLVDEISFFAALLFTVHPANVESVVYLASIGEVLYTFLGLLAIWIFLRGVNYQIKDIENKSLFFSFLLLFLGLLAKESAITIFFILFLYLLLFVKPKCSTPSKISSPKANKFKIYGKFMLGTGITTAFYCFLRFFVARIPAASIHPAPISQAPLFQRLLTIPYEIFSYFKLVFFPKDLSISHHFVVSSLNDILFWGSFIFLSALFSLVGVLLFRRKSKVGSFFLFWFFLSIFPLLNIIPLDMSIAERWLYFPAIGIFALISFLAVPWGLKLQRSWRMIFNIFLIFIILSLGARTIIRNANWRNGITLYSHDIQYSANSGRYAARYIEHPAHYNFDIENNYGVELFRIGEFEKAKEHFKKSIKAQPNWTYPHNNLGAILEREGNFEMAKEEYEKSIKLSDYYLAYENLGNLLLKMEKTNEAKDFLEGAILKFPRNANLKCTLALVYYKEGDVTKAISLLKVAQRDDPQNLRVNQILQAIQTP